MNQLLTTRSSPHTFPLVSVAVITYNHERFIAQAIDSVLMQETDFPVELIIGEDCSSDTTRHIIAKYAARYPQRIHLLLHEHNLGVARNAMKVFARCQGKYIAMLEGDDYWTDKQKLARQVEFMEREPGCAVCHHRVIALHEPSKEIRYEYPPEQWRRERVEWPELLHTNFIQTCSVLYRRSVFPTLNDAYLDLRVLDWPLAILTARHGWIGYLDQCMSVYRLHGQSNWQATPFEQSCFHTLEMFAVLENSFDSCERGWITVQLDKTRLRLAAECNRERQPLWSHKVAWICLRRALSIDCKERFEFVRRVAILVLPAVMIRYIKFGRKIAHVFWEKLAKGSPS